MPLSLLYMSRPHIALHKRSNVMQEKDYSMSFKLSEVKEVERGFISKRGLCVNMVLEVTAQ